MLRQDELAEKFHLQFAILTRDRIEASRSGNPFDEAGLWIACLDMLSRNENLQARLFAAREWHLVVCDEAHRMSASCFRRRGQIHPALPARPSACPAAAATSS